VQGWDESAAKVEVARLVNEYERAKSEGRLSRYGDSPYGEEATKKDFILPLFRALGWRVEDSREVSAEERILRGRADYGFKIGGVTKFYVEAKTLSKNLMERENLQQVIDYSYAKGVPWAVLTNFAQTAVLYSEAKDPNPFNCRFIELAAREYVSEFDRLRLLSRPAIAGNELDSKAEAFGRKPKKQPIDKQLLKDLNSFRLDLAKDIRHLNGDQFRESDEALEETVQRILDRLIFIRVAEDRGLEDKQLSLLSKGPETTTVKRLHELFRRYDDNFDSKLFQRHAADDVRMDGEILQRVLRGLHETEDGAIRYDFGAIDADVLGVMYEQYLGLILRQTAKRAKLADGAVNRKEQGIYYTPTWVADYIVKFAIGEALKRKGAKADRLRVLDPACGSGTFLLRAFDHMMRARNPTGAAVQARFDPETAGPLLALRTSVLTDNLFGVDLDARAVEIAQLNLMIRAAESRHRLPTLEKNIQVGNSLVEDEDIDPRAFDWSRGFPSASEAGGFDVVVGNPPWVQSKFLPEHFKEYYSSKYSNASKQYDLFTIFVERGFTVLRPGGILGFIVPDRFIANPDYKVFREWLLKTAQILRITPTGEGVFEGVEMPSAIMLLQKPPRGVPSAAGEVEIHDGVNGKLRLVSQRKLAGGTDLVFSGVFSDEEAAQIIGKIERGSVQFGSLFNNARGVEIGKSHPAISSTVGDVPFLIGSDISRYQTRGTHWLKLRHPDIPERDYKEPGLYQGRKILIRKTGTGINATLDKDSYVIQVVYIFKPKRADVDLYHILGILNSKLMAFYYFSKFGQKERGVFPHLTQNKVLQLPMRLAERGASGVSELVTRILDDYSALSNMGGLHLDKESRIRARIAELDEQIDEQVFRLYGLDKEDQETVRASLRDHSPLIPVGPKSEGI
jgi:type I restriction-modification system DNA methylase subunit